MIVQILNANKIGKINKKFKPNIIYNILKIKQNQKEYKFLYTDTEYQSTYIFFDSYSYENPGEFRKRYA